MSLSSELCPSFQVGWKHLSFDIVREGRFMDWDVAASKLKGMSAEKEAGSVKTAGDGQVDPKKANLQMSLAPHVGSGVKIAFTNVTAFCWQKTDAAFATDLEKLSFGQRVGEFIPSLSSNYTPSTVCWAPSVTNA